MCVGTNGFWLSLSKLQKEGLDSLIMKQRCRGSQGKIWTKHCFVRTHVDMLISSCDGESQRTVICFWACISYRLLTKWGNAKQQCYRKMGWGGGYLQAKTTHSVLSSDQMLKWLTVKHSLSVFSLKQLCVLNLWQLPSMFFYEQDYTSPVIYLLSCDFELALTGWLNQRLRKAAAHCF